MFGFFQKKTKKTKEITNGKFQIENKKTGKIIEFEGRFLLSYNEQYFSNYTKTEIYELKDGRFILVVYDKSEGWNPFDWQFTRTRTYERNEIDTLLHWGITAKSEGDQYRKQLREILGIPNKVEKI